MTEHEALFRIAVIVCAIPVTTFLLTFAVLEFWFRWRNWWSWRLKMWWRRRESYTWDDATKKRRKDDGQ